MDQCSVELDSETSRSGTLTKEEKGGHVPCLSRSCPVVSSLICGLYLPQKQEPFMIWQKHFSQRSAEMVDGVMVSLLVVGKI